MIVRTAELTDASSVAALAGELGYSTDASAMAERLRWVLGLRSDAVLVAEEAGTVAGWIQTHTSVALESGYRVEILGLVVAEQFRRSGVGRMLVEAAEAWARAQKITAVVVRSNVLRLESHAFYPALGYQRAKTQEVYRKAL